MQMPSYPPVLANRGHELQRGQERDSWATVDHSFIHGLDTA